MAAGHEVLFATPAKAVAAVAAAGVPVAAAGDPDTGPAEVLREFPEVASLEPEARPELVFAKLFGRLVAPPMLEALEPIAAGHGAELVIADAAAFAAPIVAARLGVPCVSKGFGPALPEARVARAGDEVAPLWEARGLEPRPYGGIYDTLFLDVYPPALDRPPGPHVAHVQAMRQDAFDGDAPAAVPSPTDRGDRPLVYLTMGTVFADTEPMRIALDALAGLDVRVLATVGSGIDPEDLGPQPAHVRVERFVAQTAVLPRCALVVSHGGSGTTLAAAALGLPQLCLPQGADQFLNADALSGAGAGLSLTPGQADGEAIGNAAARLLAEPSFTTAARTVAASIAAMPPPAELIPLLEGLTP